MITVHKYGPAFGLPDGSPFVVKVETYLRMTGQAYEVALADVRKAPRKQLPFIELDGERIPDSSTIIARLEARRGDALDAHLDAAQRATGLAFKTMLEEHLYFGLLYLRWATPAGWAVFEPTLRAMLGAMGVPSLLRGLVAKKARQQVIARGRIQGMGRRPHAEIITTCTAMVDALAQQLGDGPFFLGAQPSSVDATVYAFVSGMLCPAFTHEVRAHAEARPNLVAYAARMHAAYWAEA